MPEQQQPNLRLRLLLISLGLALLTFVAYWPLTRNGFVSFDDPQYLLENTHVTTGFTWANITWAFTSGYAANWHPVTWLSHMLDYSLFGLRPAGHHLMSLALHISVSVLLFLLLLRLTAALWRSALVAALFALHPLHVESVAWASERKDVLSALFFILTLLAYARYVEVAPPINTPLQRGERRTTPILNCFNSFYILALVLFALGLMSKPMLVTTPFVLLLLDYWPLHRLRGQRRQLLLEKLPFFVLAIAASAITFLVQKADGAVASLDHRPFSLRLANAIVSYVRYVLGTFWPADLAVIYPYPNAWPFVTVLGCASLLLAISVFFCSRAKKDPWLFTGWFWFLGMLVPTIGLVQVGRQAMADRYMYLPSIGLFIVVVWGAYEVLLRVRNFAARENQPRSAVLTQMFSATASVLILSLCTAATIRQTAVWRNGETLFHHALAATKDNGPAYSGLGAALVAAGKPNDALPFLEQSLRLDLSSADAHFNLGTVLLQIGRANEAIPHLETVVASFPAHVKARINLGCALFNLGKVGEAETQFAGAVKLEPSNPQAHYALGTALLAQSKVEPATAELSTAVNLNPKYVSEAVKLNPNAPLLRYNLGTILLMQSHLPDAIEQLSAAVTLDPGFREAHRNLAIAFMQAGRQVDGITHFREALRLNPVDPDLLADLGLALLEQNQPEEALSQFREGLKLRPDDVKLRQRAAEAQARLASK